MRKNQLHSFRDAILAGWQEEFWASYPEESRGFFKATQDQFANPVGSVFTRDSERLVDGLLSGCPGKDLKADLEPMIRVRAVQELAPSQAVGFLLQLKAVARAEVAKSGSSNELEHALSDFHEAVDRLLLVGFDMYTKCREDIFSIRVKAVENRSLKVMERLNEWRDRRSERAESGVSDVDS